LHSPDSFVAPVASLAEFADKHDIAFSQIAGGGNSDQPPAGDRIAMLVTLCQEFSIQQWLAIITQDTLTKKEREMKPLPEEVLYSSTGREMHFTNTRSALNVQFVGPFTLNGSAVNEELNAQLRIPHRTLVNQEQLNFSLDRYGRTAMDLTQRCTLAEVNMSALYHVASPHPLSGDQLEKGKRFLNTVQPTEDEERTVFSVSAALNAFLSAALDINEFSDVADCVLNKPSFGGIISGFGVHRFLSYDVGTVRSMDAGYVRITMPAYRMPLRLLLNHETALQAVITMTAARPPLQTCAGNIEVYAEHPLDPGKRLLIQSIVTKQCHIASVRMPLDLPRLSPLLNDY
jgi:hypothetical protein